MKNLHYYFFYQTEQPQVDALDMKLLQIRQVSPAEMGIPEHMRAEAPEMQYAWSQAIRQLKEIPRTRAPRQMLILVGKAIEIIQHSFALYLNGS